MVTLANSGVGRILLHLRAMLGDRCVRFHVAGILRELPWLAAALTLLTRARASLTGALVLYLAQPVKHYSPAVAADARSFAGLLVPGDVLLSDGNTRVATLVKRITQSTWSHVSMYVGPLEEGPDPPCIVEADVAAGVRSIRPSQLQEAPVRGLRPIGVYHMEPRRLGVLVV